MRRGTLSDLTTFIAVADSRSFRGAGERLGVTASALSHSMKQLEERVGTAMLNAWRAEYASAKQRGDAA